MQPSRRSSLRAASIIGSLAATWGVLFLAASQQPGYNHLRDGISALASRSAHLPWIGAIAIAMGGIATLAASFVLRRISQPAALSLALAGVALLVVAGTPISCAGGPAGCEMYPGGSNWISKTHLAAVGFYEFASVSAAMSAALALLRGGARRVAGVCAAGALISLLLFSAAPVELGLMQRAWLLLHSLLLAGVPYLSLPAPGGRGHGVVPATHSRRATINALISPEN
jgi:hypothetical protein